MRDPNFNGSESSAAGALMIDRECMRASHPTPLETPEVGVPRFPGTFREKPDSLLAANSLHAVSHLSRENRASTCEMETIIDRRSILMHIRHFPLQETRDKFSDRDELFSGVYVNRPRAMAFSV